MRQGQHTQHNKNRQRGRGRRPGGNPGNRVYESNGPDVKVRGTAQHVSEKYLQLARDAQSAGNIITAENYFQHAEHYLRIIAATQPPQQQQPQLNQNDRQVPETANGSNEAESDAPRSEATVEPAPGSGPQPGLEASVIQNDQPEDRVEADSPVQEPPGWDGPQPEFLRKAAPDGNGSEKPKRARKPRKQAKNGKSPEAADVSEPVEEVAAAAPPEDAETAAG